MKNCFKCGNAYPLTEFYKLAKMRDGVLNKCKDCTKRDAKAHYTYRYKDPSFVSKERKRGREKHHRLYAGTGIFKANPDSVKRWQEKFPEKAPAAHYAYKRVQRIKGLENHHWSYNIEHWDDVIKLTKRHHMKAHRFIKYDPEYKMYRTHYMWELLDTREKHFNHIYNCVKKLED